MVEFESTEELVKALGGDVLPEEPGLERDICAVALLVLAAEKGWVKLGSEVSDEEKRDLAEGVLVPEGFEVVEIKEERAGLTVRYKPVG